MIGGCFFFFSSRRRHTRFDCDWSSDVCSSDHDSATAPAPLPSLPAGAAATVPVDQLKVLLRPKEIRYVQQESVLLPPTANIKALYVRSEEHTSELQSQSNLVCRLLLEKKKNT